MIPQELIDRALAARAQFIAAVPELEIDEYRDAMSALEVFRFDNGLADSDALLGWIGELIQPGQELGYLLDPEGEGWWRNTDANAAVERWGAQQPPLRRLRRA